MLQLKKFPNIPVSTQEESESPAHIQSGPVSACSLERRDPIPVWWERIPGDPVAPQEKALSTGKARGTPGSCHHSQSPPDVSVHSRETCFPCTASTLKPRIDSHHGGIVGQPREKALWESLVGKPQGKATDLLIHAKGSVTLVLQLGRKAHVHAPARDED